jgi:DNA modification methylase
MNLIDINDIIIYPEQREVRLNHAADIAAKIKERGYTPGYPITLDDKNGLVDGGHRIEAAKLAGLTELPYVLKPPNVSNVAHAIHCNEDGASTITYDVFDYANHCYTRAKAGWELKDIAAELGWGSDKKVIQYKNIITKLHSNVLEVTKSPDLVTAPGNGLVTSEVTKVTWKETYFRAIFPHLTFDQITPDRTIYRAQLKTIKMAITNPKKVTAKWIGNEAQKHSWHATLSRYMRDNIADRAPITDRKILLKNIYGGVFGDKETDNNRDKFERAVSAINENILGVILYQDNSFQKIPTLDDKSVALVITDPPYNVTDNEWDKIGTDEQYIEFIAKFLDVLKPKLADNYHFFMCISPHYQAQVERLLIDTGWPLKSRIIWSHRNMSKGRDVTDKFICMWEMVFHCGTHPLNWSSDWNEERFEVQEWAAPQTNFNDEKVHPTQKPIGMFELFVKVGSSPGDIILDPFAGGGTTGAACKEIAQRQCVLIELENEYCEAIEERLSIKRWQE